MTNWLTCRRRRPEAPLRLYCFPHSGGLTSEYVRWCDDLPDVEVLGVQLPGRGARFGEPSHTTMTSLVAAIADEVDFQPPCAFFGHSLGALVAFEVARVAGPALLVASACRAPDLGPFGHGMHLMGEEEFVAAARGRYPLPADPELLDLFLPPLRADLTVLGTYHHVPGRPLLGCPVLAVGGEQDDVPREAVAGWARHTTGRCDVTFLPGGHFYLRDQRAALMSLLQKSFGELESAGERQRPLQREA